MEGFYYIENAIDECRSAPSAYFPTLEEAKEAIRFFADWFCQYGTGRIFYQGFGFDKSEYSRFDGRKEFYGNKPAPKFICRAKGIDEKTGKVIFSDKEF